MVELIVVRAKAHAQDNNRLSAENTFGAAARVHVE
jgi:hypothetical protein